MQTAIKPIAHCNELNASFNEADYKLYVQVDCGCSVLLFIALCILMDVVCVQELNLSWFHRNLVQCSLRVTLRNGVINIYLSIYLSFCLLSIYLSISTYIPNVKRCLRQILFPDFRQLALLPIFFGRMSCNFWACCSHSFLN